MKIAVLPGDGIGSEIVAQAVKVLEALRRDGLKIELEYAHIGGAGYDAAADPLPEATLKLAQDSDAVLLGAVGGYQYDTLPRAMRPEQGLLRIRKGLGLFANLRPALVYPELVNASSSGYTSAGRRLANKPKPLRMRNNPCSGRMARGSVSY